MKKTLILIFITLFNISSAATAADLKIAVVDIQQVLQDSKAANDIREKIKTKRDKYQDEITKEEEKLREEEKKLASQSGVLAQEVFEQKREEFKEKLIKVQRDVQVKRANLDNTLSGSLAQVQEVVFQIIEDLAKENGFEVAIPTSQILYANKSLNITDEVLKRLDKKLPKVKTPE
ncbi:MAG: OmpH family outer membrane protein [Rickettsiales bacterium]|nr:OmpH family outer membrane protein [Pseudomonadota bacterium]MDA0966504.1 OmpH family outer membrane protein [Pseudomonadota bacterium]MDG4543366.1 OmpH family outer membrane protein [Rickettsiales bacterium]MDG4545632.1 OmpH family outer membrane protein [Rickettsiales bacterium]MDG4548081.1 OmpH family outer membrane protein [Rickettsiales bacterium]